MKKLNLGKREFWMPLMVKHAADPPEAGEYRFVLRVKDLGSRQWRELLRDLNAIQADANLSDDERDSRIAERLETLVTGWRDVCDGEDREIPFSPEAFRQLLDITGMVPAIARAYGDSFSTAMAEAQLKA